VLTYRTGAASKSGGKAMATYLLESTIAPGAGAMAEYYYSAAAELRRDTDPHLANLLAIDQHRPLNADELANLLGGRRADGQEIEAASKSKTISFVDLCWSADKSVSLAWAFAPTDAERDAIVQAHRDAVASAMEVVSAELGWARKGAGGRGGADAGHTTWVKFDHYTARPTLEIAAGDHTELVQMPVAADPNLHSHLTMLNLVLTDTGRIGSLDLKRMEGRVHEWGAYYQAHLAQNLRALGADVVLDHGTGAARLTAIPERVRDQFSKRTLTAEQIAKKWARENGQDWNKMSAAEKIELAHRGATKSKRSKDTAPVEEHGDIATWQKQAREIGWKQDRVLAAGPVELPEVAREERHEIAYTAALPWVDRAFARSAVVDLSEIRVAATRGLIAAGVDGPEETDAVVAAMFDHGIRQESQATRLIAIRDGHHTRVTTELHVKREQELVAMARVAAADRSTALSPEAIEAAVQRSGLSFRSEHGKQQRAIIDRLGTGGRLGVAIGGAGVGKTSLLAPLVDAWHQDGRQIYGAAIAWRQTDDLADAGIQDANRFALSVLLERAEVGQLRLDRKSVLVIDELGTVGTSDMGRLLTLQAATGAQVVAVGDDRQMQSIEAGPVIDLMRRALGPEQLPELVSIVRQQTVRERETSLIFREGRAAEALERKQADGSLHIVPGGYRDAVERVANLAIERRQANAADPKYRLTISAPTNADARAIGAAIRQRRRAMGEVGPDKINVPAIDQVGASYELPLAVGDRVRLFANTPVMVNGRAGSIGRNGSVLDVLAIEADGITLRNARGTVGKVAWEKLTDRSTSRIKLTYGDALTTNASQGVTSAEHIDAMPGGTKFVNAYGAYVGQTRHRRASYLIVSDGAERQEITARRPIGDPRAIVAKDVLANMARNLSRQPEKASALALLDTTTEDIPMEKQTMSDTAYLDRLRRRTEEARTVRLYRAEAPDQPVADWIAQGARDAGTTEASGRLFTTDRTALDWYVKDAGPNARVVAVDVPASLVETYRVINSTEVIAGRAVRSFSRDPENEFFLPRELAEQRKPVEQLEAAESERAEPRQAQTQRRRLRM
jgi:conjugative relaxase-like TrwC/TraI family protein